MIGTPFIVALLVALPAVHLEVATDAASPCAAGAALEEQLRLRLPGVRIEHDAPDEPGDLHASLRRDQGAWLLQVRDGERVALHRTLHFGETECRVAAETGALIVERFLVEVRWPGRPASIEPLPAPPPPPPPEAAPPIVASPPPERVAAPVAPASVVEPRRHFTLALGPAAWLGLPSDLRAAAMLTATLRLSEPLEAGLLVLASAASSQPVLIGDNNRGSSRVQPALIALFASACAEATPVRLCAGGLAGARGSYGSASGARLFQQTSGLIVQPEMGLRASAAVRLSSHFELGLELLSAAALGSASFVVQSSPPVSRALPTFDVVAALHLGWEAL